MAWCSFVLMVITHAKQMSNRDRVKCANSQAQSYRSKFVRMMSTVSDWGEAHRHVFVSIPKPKFHISITGWSCISVKIWKLDAFGNGLTTVFSSSSGLFNLPICTFQSSLFRDERERHADSGGKLAN